LERSIGRQHALENTIAFDKPMVEGTRDVERDHRTEQNPAAADAVKV
jgi:hypothetical protein